MARPDDHPSPSNRHDNLFMWIGICIKEWAKVEAALFEVCHLILKADIAHVAIIFYRTPTLDSRLTLADELVRTIIPARGKKGSRHKNLAAWDQLVKDIRALLPVRNLLAHSPLQYVHHTEWSESEETGEIEPIESYWLEIATSYQERLRGRPARSVKDEELPNHFQKILAVLVQLSLFVTRLKAKPQARRAGRVRRKARR